MSDFAMLIDNAMKREVRSQLVAFLDTFDHLEFGRRRKLTTDETALVLACIDRFLRTTSFTDLGVTNIWQLRKRLDRIAHLDEALIAGAMTDIRNSCFDSLACIAALEARLCRAIDRHEVRTMSWSAPPRQAAND